MSHRLSALLILIVGVAFFVFNLVGHGLSESSDGAFLLLAGGAFTVVGALIIARSEGNRVGWVASVTGLSLLGSGVVGYWADQGLSAADAIGGALWLSWLFLTGLLMFWFPTGRALSPRWRWVGWIGLTSEILILTYIVSDQLCVEGGEPCRGWVDNPIGIPGVPNPEYGSTSGLTFGLLSAFALISLISLIVRYVRSQGIERLQIKWFAFAVIFLIGVIILQENLDQVPWIPGDLLFAISALGVPVAIGIAVLRYRLYEIDRIISRTVSYTLVVGILGAAYVGVLTWLTSLLPDLSQLVVAGATLGVAFLFNPLRRRVQAAVDRRFNRSRYHAERVMDGFAETLRDEVDPGVVITGWVGVVSDTMHPSALGVWVRH